MFQTKRNQSASPIISVIGHLDHGGKDVHYDTPGLSKREELAMRIYIARVEQIGITPNFNPYREAASEAIAAADIFFDELERPAREHVEQIEREISERKRQFELLLDAVVNGDGSPEMRYHLFEWILENDPEGDFQLPLDIHPHFVWWKEALDAKSNE